MHFFKHIQKALPADTRKHMLDCVTEAFETLEERERKIIELRVGFGRDDGYTRTLKQLGDLFDLSASTIRWYETRALQKLCEPLRFQKLSEFVKIYPFGEPNLEIVEAIRLCQVELIAYVTRHPEKLREVSPEAFERIIAGIMRGLRFDVELTQKTRDGGRDIVAVGLDRLGITTKYVIECKRYAPDRPVRVGLVRCLYGVKQEQRADHAILATTSYFTSAAIKFSRSPQVWNLHLKDFEALKEWLRTYEEMMAKGAVLL